MVQLIIKNVRSFKMFPTTFIEQSSLFSLDILNISIYEVFHRNKNENWYLSLVLQQLEWKPRLAAQYPLHFSL